MTKGGFIGKGSLNSSLNKMVRVWTCGGTFQEGISIVHQEVHEWIIEGTVIEPAHPKGRACPGL